MEQQFVSILRSALIFQWIPVFILLAMGAFGLFINFISIPKSKKKQTFKQKVKAALDSISMITGCIFVVAILLSLRFVAITIPMVKDINNQSFCSVHGDFVNNNASNSATSITVTTDDGEEFHLYLPFGADPYGKGYIPTYHEFSGTMWYSENSHLALLFEGDKGDWRFYKGQADWWDDDT